MAVDQRRLGHAEPLRQRREVYAFIQAQAHQQGFGSLLAPAELALLDQAVTVADDRLEEVFGLAVPRCGHAAAQPVGSRADPDIILVARVSHVVATCDAWLVMDADLVGWDAGSRGVFAGEGEEVRRGIVGQRLERALPHVGSESRIGLYLQLV